MERLLSDRYFRIFLIIVGIIIVADIVNVFVIGGPSVFSFLKPASAVAGSSSAATGIAIATPLANTSGNLASGVSEKATLSLSETQTGRNDDIYVPTKATPLPTVNYVTDAKPIGTMTTSPTLRYVAPTQTQQDSDATARNTFVAIYSRNLSFNPTGEPVAVSLDVTKPPLIINFTVSPDMAHRIKVVDNRTGSKAINTTTYDIHRPSEDAWFTVTVYDRTTGNRIDQDGFGGLYDLPLENQYILRNAGQYIIQFEGADIDAQVDMFLDRDNIASLS